MSSVDAPNSSLVPGTSVPGATFTRSHSTPSVDKNVHTEDLELSEATAQLPPLEQKRSILEVHVSQTGRSLKFRARIQFFALCWTLFLAGWSDSSTGPLLPRIQSVYHVLSLPQARYMINKRLPLGWLCCRFHHFHSKLHCAPTSCLLTRDHGID